MIELQKGSLLQALKGVYLSEKSKERRLRAVWVLPGEHVLVTNVLCTGDLYTRADVLFQEKVLIYESRHWQADFGLVDTRKWVDT